MVILERSDFPEMVLDVTMHHHEKIDGSGYPNGVGAELSAYARIAYAYGPNRLSN
ncbi:MULTISPECIES: HD domain-containing phosphohydrolase [unclassified Aureimonas]|uniref:HD domain-containing phosphohydrolase n=1 Tax=unclassified Aureimonas TaxID=2615206 RepID=UPI002378C3F9|nr:MULTISPECIES: HD domain-containing phosphohydrolase [unclassified Aureimonas]